METAAPPPVLSRPSWRISLPVCAGAVIVWGVLRLVIFQDIVLPLTYALPLLICVWSRDRRQLWGMAAIFALMATVKMFRILPPDALEPAHQWAVYSVTLVNITVAAGVVHAVMSLRDALERRNLALAESNRRLAEAHAEVSRQNELLQRTNQELEATNEELAASEEEIARQNEELQTQAEELVQQNEELRLQGEELEQQSEELRNHAEQLQTTNEELEQREQMLQNLLSATGSLTSEQEVLARACRLGVSLLGAELVASAVLEARGDELHLRAHHGLRLDPDSARRWPLRQSLVRVALAENRVTALDDVTLRPDLVSPAPERAPCRAALAAPLQIAQQTIGALEFYAAQPYRWTDDQFRLAEWVAAQAALALEAVHLREQLAESRRSLDLALAAADMGSWELSFADYTCTYGPRAQRLYGLSSAVIRHDEEGVRRLIHPEDCPAMWRALQAACAPSGDGRYRAEYRVRGPGGAWHWLSVSGLVEFAGENGQRRPARMIGASRDITAQKRAEAALRESEERYRATAELLQGVVDNIPVLLCIWEPQLQRFRFNRHMTAVLGWTEADAADGQFMLRAYPDPAYRDEVIRYMQSLQAGWRDVTTTARDGSLVECSWANVALPGGTMIGIGIDIRERKRAEAALRESEARFRIMADGLPLMIWVHGPDGEQQFVNRTFCNFAGLAPEEVCGARWQQLVHPDDAEHYFAEFRTCTRDRRPFVTECRVRRADGAWRWVESHGEPRFSDSGAFLGIVGASLDITERKLLQRERDELLDSERAARSAAERAARTKDEFLATLSHELRTPLGAILGWAQMLRRGQLDVDEAAEAVEVIEANARLQKQLIEDLLDMSRVISGKLRLDLQPVDVAALAREAVAMFRPDAHAKALDLQARVDENAGQVQGDAGRLKQVLGNLLSNAVKFTPAGGRVLLRVTRVREEVVIAVRDTGVGLAPEFIPQMFERFRQADSSTTRKYRGLGLGLALVKQLVELHGGSVRAKSRGPGKGATFVVRLPRLCSPPLPDPQDGLGLVALGDLSLAGITALVVDDEPATLGLIRRLLREAGAEITACASAAEALLEIQTRRYGILVSDISMPGEDGYTLLRKIRRLPDREQATTPAIALTAFSRPGDRSRAFEAGFQTHMVKPVEATELCAAVANLARREERGATDGDPQSAGEARA